MIRIYGQPCSFPYDPGEEPIQPGRVRIYEFMHGYEEISIEEYNERVEAYKNDPLCQIIEQEIQKEINAEVIRQINVRAKIHPQRG